MWDTLCLTILLGLLSFLPVFSVGTLFVLLCVLAAWLTVHVQMLSRPSLHKYDSAYVMDDSSSDLTVVAASAAGNGGHVDALGLGGLDDIGQPDIEADGFAEDCELIEGSNNNFPSSAFDKAFVRE